MTFKRVWETRVNGFGPRVWNLSETAYEYIAGYKDYDKNVRITLRSYVVPA